MLMSLGASQGTTSAHAENTRRAAVSNPTPGNYLRARGEYHQTWEFDLKSWELPPRTRRIHIRQKERVTVVGTTSAHAENT